jgi:epsilon-lactone hydrolase
MSTPTLPSTTTVATEDENGTTTSTTPLWAYIPDTISPEWRAVIVGNGELRDQESVPAPNDIAGWKAYQDSANASEEAQADDIAKEYGVTYTETQLGGVPVIDIMPSRALNKDKNIAVYCHGGGYVLFSAKAMLKTAILFAAATKLRVISIDYTLAPHSKWQDTTDQVIRVYRALITTHGLNATKSSDIVLFGDSAGGGLAAAATLKMRDLFGVDSMPAALVLWAPWTDLTETGDTYVTLRDAEPNILYERFLGPAALAYANECDQKHPYVSPVYGDFTRGFPPTLIQGGTKEIFLSNFVRLYQAIDQAGGTAKLDIYEGMTHVFQSALPNSRESQAAMAKVCKWIEQHLPLSSST